ncbi:hypothetical protein [Zunongwangia atlantica]|uniref:YD repeat-containing protein n=1 Tax=Zunongwangia atlantica 22II14-10F7 TaxID=1185767 RepID=A0A1Y1SY74_9FLAO|nr:hypothetical protein [Zunongwangia atlantica]ORL43708.1 YD repeat-containing protein [Zunongwangia atlantica 22II14-10F7]|tara:strand:- start:5996 stop:9217 length:3222 start_codon:yes stop_codon:yes gene_type:complete
MIDFKKTLAFLIVIFYCFGLKAQEENSIGALPEIAPPSPTAYEFTKYGDIPLDESTGVANISIPLIDYSAGSLNLPISMSYATTGIKVDQIASWVGMGWNLNAGGIITRSVRGVADEIANSKNFQSLATTQSWYTSSKLNYLNFLRSVVDDGDAIDFEPDVYNFKFVGFSGSFILDEQSNPILLKQDRGLKIELLAGGNFKFITSDGTEFVFDVKETTQPQNTCTTGNLEPTVTSAWYLSKITALNGDEITLNYNSHSMFYASGFNQTYSVPYYYTGGSQDCTAPTPVENHCELYSSVSSKKISSISNNRNSKTIVFTTSTRGDIENTSVKLSGIQYKNGSVIIKDYDFYYDLITSTSNTTNTHLNNSIYKKRIFLNRIEDNTGSESKTHQFLYNSPNLLPPRFSFAQDLLGFNNGEFSNQSLYPDFVGSLYNVSYTEAERAGNFTYTKNGILEKVIYPTGGYTEIEYEPNSVITSESSYVYDGFNVSVSTSGTEYSSHSISPQIGSTLELSGEVNIVSGSDIIHDRALLKVYNTTTSSYILNENVQVGTFNFSVNLNAGNTYQISLDLSPVIIDDVEAEVYGSYISDNTTQSVAANSGIRVKKLIDVAGSSSSPIIKRFYYNDMEHYNEERLPLFGSVNLYQIDEKRLQCGDYYEEFKITSGNWNQFYYFNNSIGFYDQVTISFGGDSFQNGGIEKTFLASYDGSKTTFGTELIPNGPLSNVSPYKGELLKEIVFKSNSGTFEKLKETIYNYDTTRVDQIDAYYGRNKSPAFVCPIGGNLSTMTAGTQDYEMNHYYVLSEKRNLIGKIEKSYFGTGDVTSTVEYEYNGINHDYPTKILTYQSDNAKVTSQQIWYPRDITSTSSLGFNSLSSQDKSVIDNMVLNNVVEQPIQKQKQVKSGNTVLSNEVERYLFLNNSGQFLPKNIQVLKGTYNSSSNPLRNLLTYHEYDNYGNLMEVAREGGSHILYLWGYNRQFPIAKIENTTKTILQNALGTLTNIDETDLVVINNLRNNTAFKESMITTYEYDPSVGIVGLRDPSGLETNFFYDTNGRLKVIKDNDGNIIEEYEYHYKGE